jgi:chromosome partitioning protein
MIICFVNQKGGVGKSTAAINIASSLARKNNQVLLIDADPQGSAAKWHGIEGNQSFRLMHQTAGLRPADAQTLSQSYDHIVIDAPPAIGEITRSILMISDVAVIPVSPSSLDLWSCKDTLQMIEEVQRQNTALTPRFLINRKIPGTRVGREVREALAEFNPLTLTAELCQRVAYVDAMKYGVSVMQFAPGSKAAGEIESLCDELIGAVAADDVDDVDHADEVDDAPESHPIAELYKEETENILFRSFQTLFS